MRGWLSAAAGAVHDFPRGVLETLLAGHLPHHGQVAAARRRPVGEGDAVAELTRGTAGGGDLRHHGPVFAVEADQHLARRQHREELAGSDAARIGDGGGSHVQLRRRAVPLRAVDDAAVGSEARPVHHPATEGHAAEGGERGAGTRGQERREPGREQCDRQTAERHRDRRGVARASGAGRPARARPRAAAEPPAPAPPNGTGARAPRRRARPAAARHLPLAPRGRPRAPRRPRRASRARRAAAGSSPPWPGSDTRAWAGCG